ncbi:hypothetical protein Syun_029404 [Stephania yunnanensis]|uniref:Alliinase C-terminal domain-containing protein n=1 Tax=Stephania yunnanensis TaxID=152371 RepID=A0AAP0E5A9_9MAGN
MGRSWLLQTSSSSIVDDHIVGILCSWSHIGYWMKSAESTVTVVSGWHRMSYLYEDGSYISRELEKVIRRLHEVVGNANTKRKLTFASLDSLKSRAWIDFRSVDTALLLLPTKMSELIFTTIVNLLTPTSLLDFQNRASYKRMKNYLDVNSIGSSRDTQLRMLKCEEKEYRNFHVMLRAAGIMGWNGEAPRGREKKANVCSQIL